MESKEILKGFAGKLAGLSAAAKVVAIAGAVSSYSGTGHAAANVVKAESRITATISNESKVSSEKEKSKEVSEGGKESSEEDNENVLESDAEFSDSQSD